MSVYWDSSALIKRYFRERGSAQVLELLASASISSTVVLTRAEIAGAFSRAVSKGFLTTADSHVGIREFRRHWPSYLRIRLTEGIVRQADHLAIEHSLRGYDAVHLAGALAWSERTQDRITFATFDDNLWKAAIDEGLDCFPEILPSNFLRKSN